MKQKTKSRLLGLLIVAIDIILLTSMASCGAPHWQVRNKYSGYQYYIKGWPASINCPDHEIQPMKKSTYKRYSKWRIKINRN
jgi:hypothetical protein